MRLLPSFFPRQNCIVASSPHGQDCPDGLKLISDQLLSVETCANRRPLLDASRAQCLEEKRAIWGEMLPSKCSAVSPLSFDRYAKKENLE
ncbi:unnamed protein product [Spirodela intermedia]|uniref:Uncharacterized protein n=1 Tax=Spirodela intermedia TaxID=51605 RepID=A0A7I8IVT5_SPIIN|nr:unnamed protein product [Spirodela intermedia]CAA6661693.1 unnamed protein product [Spirodela intermedia]